MKRQMSLRLKLYYLSLYISLLLCLGVEFLQIFADAESKKKRKKKKSKYAFTRSDQFIRIAKILLCLSFLPPIFTFIYYVVRDPVTPHVLMELWYRLRESTTTYLGRSGNVMARKLYKEE
jgi:hypothetical protein